MKCASCGFDNREGVKFCENCGEAMEAKTGRFCPDCGHQNRPGVKFCENCGAPMGARSLNQLAPRPVPQPQPMQPQVVYLDRGGDRRRDWLFLAGGLLLVLLCFFGFVLLPAPGPGDGNRPAVINDAQSHAVNARLQLEGQGGLVGGVIKGAGKAIPEPIKDAVDGKEPGGEPPEGAKEGVGKICSWMRETECLANGYDWQQPQGKTPYCSCQQAGESMGDWCRREGGDWSTDRGACVFGDLIKNKPEAGTFASCNWASPAWCEGYGGVMADPVPDIAELQYCDCRRRDDPLEEWCSREGGYIAHVNDLIKGQQDFCTWNFRVLSDWCIDQGGFASYTQTGGIIIVNGVEQDNGPVREYCGCDLRDAGAAPKFLTAGCPNAGEFQIKKFNLSGGKNKL